MTAVVDCCHSGTIFDLPFEYDKKMSKTNYKAVRFPHMETVREERRRIAEEKQGTIPSTNIVVKKRVVQKTDLTPPPPTKKIAKAPSRTKSLPIQKKKPSSSDSGKALQKRAPKKPLSISSVPRC
jgi:hypothetical protein